MRSAAQYLALLIVLGGAALYYRDQVKTFAFQAYREAVPCSVPLSYALESVDPRFSIATSAALRALENAERVWEDAAGTQLFVRAEAGELSVRLIYDARQETTQTLKEFGITVEENVESYEAARSAYQTMLASYQRDKAAFDAAYAAFERDAARYGAEVERWNRRGGAPSSVYAELEAERERLEREESRLRGMQETLSAKADNVNTIVSVLNRLAIALNISVAEYNTVGDTVGDEFEQGVYESRPGAQSIEVYEFDSVERLERLLAHEFGHALGLEHLDDPAAIMYRLNQSKNQSLTEADIASLRALCRLE